MRSLLDGHLSLSRALSQAQQYPAIDVLASLSRVMPAVTGDAQRQAAARIRGWLAKHRDIELLLQMGEYKKGADAEADAAIAKMPALRLFLQQKLGELVAADATRATMLQLAGGADGK